MVKAKRRLAAILAADVAGYSRLMGDDEQATLNTLNAYRDVFREHIGTRDGRVVDTAGDSVLAVFDSVVESVQCAIDVQAELDARNADLHENRRMQFRIGVNSGDVIEQDDGTVYGDGVNVAARLQALAEPGGITLSEDAYRNIRTKLNLVVDDIGEHEVKNIAEPVHAFRARSHDAAPASKTEPALKLPDEFSIAVLPFDNLSSDPEQEYFADGITEDIIAGLSRFKDLDVVARNSTFRYKGQSVDVRDIGRELGARYVLEGSVRKAGDAIRVTAQLLDAADGNHLWAQTFDHTLTDTSIFQIQDDIAERVSSVIGNPFGVLAQQRFDKVTRPTTGPLNADQSVALANAYYRTLAPEDHLQARDVLERTVERDRTNADAWAMLCHMYCDEFHYGHNPLPDPLDRALQAAQRAVELQPNSDRTRAALSRAHVFRGEVGPFRAEAERVLALVPNSAHRIVQIGQFLVLAGDWDRGTELVRKGYQLDEFLPVIFRYPIMLDHYRKGEDVQALREIERFAMPRLWVTHAFSAAIYGQLGKMDEAQAAVRRLLDLNGRFPEQAREAVRRFVCADDLTDRVIDGLRKAGLDIPDEPATNE